MNLDFSSIHEDNKTNKNTLRFSKPSVFPRPMIPSINNSTNRNSFTPFIPSLSNTNAFSLNNTRLSNQVILELDKQSQKMFGRTIKKPTRYTAKELKFKKVK
jgi:hypothetical protein